MFSGDRNLLCKAETIIKITKGQCGDECSGTGDIAWKDQESLHEGVGIGSGLKA